MPHVGTPHVVSVGSHLYIQSLDPTSSKARNSLVAQLIHSHAQMPWHWRTDVQIPIVLQKKVNIVEEKTMEDHSTGVSVVLQDYLECCIHQDALVECVITCLARQNNS